MVARTNTFWKSKIENKNVKTLQELDSIQTPKIRCSFVRSFFCSRYRFPYQLKRTSSHFVDNLLMRCIRIEQTIQDNNRKKNPESKRKCYGSKKNTKQKMWMEKRKRLFPCDLEHSTIKGIQFVYSNWIAPKLLNKYEMFLNEWAQDDAF